jgi:outer membrane protein
MYMKSSLALIVALASGLALNAAAQTLPAPAVAEPAGPAKIAIIAFQAAVAQTNEGQRNFGDLQKKFEPRRQQLRALAEDIDNSTKQLQVQGDKLSDTELASRSRIIEEKKKKLQRDSEDAQNEFQQEMQEIFSNLAPKVGEVLTNFEQQQGYTLVLDYDPQKSPILYAQPSTDITKAVIEAYNAKSGVPAPPAQAAPAPKPAAPKSAAPKPAAQ